MKIICKTILYPPPPPFVGTRIKIAVTEENLNFGIFSIALAPGSEQFTIDWGDGKVQQFIGITGLWHPYERPGNYEIRLSDDVGALQIGSSSASDEKFANEYPQMVLSFVTNAANLNELKSQAFYNCSNMSVFDMPVSPVTFLNSDTFKNCSALQGRIDIPRITGIGARPTIRFFTGCTGLTEIHFPASSEEAITSAGSYLADPTLGSGNARCVFDL
jgi:hypothetical protein